MKKENKPVFFLVVVALALVSIIFAGPANAAGKTKQYKGSNYTITYPAIGFDDKIDEFVKEVDSIFPFVEDYGVLKIDHLQINVLDHELTNGAMADTVIPKLTMYIPAVYYKEAAVPHEFCHLAQYQLSLPSWFAENHADNCARRYYESIGDLQNAIGYPNFYSQQMEKYKDADSKIGEEIYEGDLSKKYGDAVAIKSSAEGYLMMNEILNLVPMKKILPKLRDDFAVNKSRDPGRFKPVSNDNIICDINAVTYKDVFSIFKKYGFTIPDCSAKPKPTATPEELEADQKAAEAAAQASNPATNAGPPTTGMIILIASTGVVGFLIILGVAALVIYLIIKLFKKLFPNRKKK